MHAFNKLTRIRRHSMICTKLHYLIGRAIYKSISTEIVQEESERL